jgi:hypothetical protein
MTLEEVALVYLNVLSRYSPVKTEEIHEIAQ